MNYTGRELYSLPVCVLSRFIGLWRRFQLLFHLILFSVFLALVCGEEVLNIGKKAFYYCLHIIRNIPLASFYKATRLLIYLLSVIPPYIFICIPPSSWRSFFFCPFLRSRTIFGFCFLSSFDSPIVVISAARYKASTAIPPQQLPISA